MNHFSPITLKESPASASPNRNLTGNPRVARDIIADFYNAIQNWNDFHIQGAKIVKEIASFKAENPASYPESLNSSTKSLYELVGKCKAVCGQLGIFSEQLRALDKLHKNGNSLFISMPISRMVELVENIHSAYEKELKNKVLVLENIAHSRSESEAMFFASLWTYQINVNSNLEIDLNALLYETGHRKVNF